MQVIINFSNGTHRYIKSPSKRKIGGLYGGISDKVGNCVVKYTKDYYNEFNFSGWEDFKNKIMPCLDASLVKEMEGSKKEKTC